MTPDIIKLLAHYYIGSAGASDFIGWARRMIESGEDTKNIRILSSFTDSAHWSEMELYLRRSFDDLGWRFPTREEALRLYACDIARSISAEIMFPEVGCLEMNRIKETLGNPQDLYNWGLFCIELLNWKEISGIYGGEIDGKIISEAQKYIAEFCR